MDSLITSFAERLTFARKRKNLTQSLLADLIASKSGKQTISSWERGQGEPSLSQLVRLAEVLGTNVEWLASGTINATPEALTTQEQPGYTLLPTNEVIAMQRELLQYKEKELREKPQ
ncbi:helix-turn-helix domain-containing protein [Spirosoma areae]